MSMFHELMMRKKEETLYPVIKGSLTDTDGVISGFINTGANYLQIDNMNKLSSVNSWEITIKIVNSSGSYFIGTNLERILTISAETSKLYLSSDGISWNIANGVGLNTAIPNDSYVRLRFTGTQYILDYSSDLTNWTNCATITSSTKISNAITSLVIGKWWTGNVNFTGSIDLNNSYIKLGSTKYNLQAVVGYTVVGSPTITDGVVSGFTTSDYVQISNFPYTSDSFEINIKATTTNTGLQQRCLYRSVNFQLRVLSSFEWELYVNGINIPLGQNPSSYPYVRIKKGSVISVYLSQDGITYSKVADNIAIGSVTDGTLTFSSTGNIWNGSIDMNNTNIYKNNKLWFNGQQA